MMDNKSFVEWITRPRYILFWFGIMFLCVWIIISPSDTLSTISKNIFLIGLFWMIFGLGQMSYDVYVGFKNKKKLKPVEVIIVEPLKYYKNYDDAVANRQKNGVIWYKSGKGKGYYIRYPDYRFWLNPDELFGKI